MITLFYGYGQNNCTGSLSTPVPAATYDAGLLDFRMTIRSVNPNFSTYYPASTQHTWIETASFYTEAEGGTKLVDWATSIINGTTPPDVGM